MWASVVVGILTLPVLGIPSEDSFPLSSYPMFSQERSRIVEVAHAIGAWSDGTETVLGPRWLGTNEVLTARAVIANAIGEAEERELCEEILRRSHDRALIAVSIRIDRFDSVGYFRGDRRPREGREVTRCTP